MSPQYHQINRKIVVLGSIKSGKSSLVSRFVDRDTSPNMIEKNIYITIKRNDQEIKLQILDTFQCNSKHMSHQASLGAHGYILCFSLASRTQFATIKLINNLLLDTMGNPPTIPRVLVGTMSDIEKRYVTTAQAEELAKSVGMSYIECSARQGTNIDQVFELVLRAIDNDSDEQVVSPSPYLPAVEYGFCAVM